MPPPVFLPLPEARVWDRGYSRRPGKPNCWLSKTGWSKRKSRRNSGSVEGESLIPNSTEPGNINQVGNIRIQALVKWVKVLESAKDEGSSQGHSFQSQKHFLARGSLSFPVFLQ